MFNIARAGSLQSIRSFGQYSARVMRELLAAHTELADTAFGTVLAKIEASDSTVERFALDLRTKT